MAELTIGEMIKQVPNGQMQAFEPPLRQDDQERYFRVRQNWDYQPGRLEWRNKPPRNELPWNGTRTSARIAIDRLSPPEVVFDGPSEDVVDFYTTGSDVYFLSDTLFRLIEESDPDSLDHLAFNLSVRGVALPFHAVMPRRVLEAVDPRRTRVVVKDEDYAGTYFRTVLFPDGIIFDNEALQGVASFSDIDAGGWYWSADLIALAKASGIRGFFAQSVASSTTREIARL